MNTYFKHNIYYLTGQLFNKHYLLNEKIELNFKIPIKIESEFYHKKEKGIRVIGEIKRTHKLASDEPNALIRFFISNLSGSLFVFAINKHKYKKEFDKECSNYNYKDLFNEKSTISKYNYWLIEEIRCSTNFKWDFENLIFPLATDLENILIEYDIFNITDNIIENNIFENNYNNKFASKIIDKLILTIKNKESDLREKIEKNKLNRDKYYISLIDKYEYLISEYVDKLKKL